MDYITTFAVTGMTCGLSFQEHLQRSAPASAAEEVPVIFVLDCDQSGSDAFAFTNQDADLLNIQG